VSLRKKQRQRDDHPGQPKQRYSFSARGAARRNAQPTTAMDEEQQAWEAARSSHAPPMKRIATHRDRRTMRRRSRPE
jgi:hypothetical protein